jgi:hypothetical protein
MAAPSWICSKRGSLVSHNRQIVSETASEPSSYPILKAADRVDIMP